MKNKYEDFSEEKIREFMSKLFDKEMKENSRPIGKLSDEEKERTKRCFGKMIDGLGDNLYHIGNGCITGEGGWDKFCEAVKKAGLNGGFNL